MSRGTEEGGRALELIELAIRSAGSSGFYKVWIEKLEAEASSLRVVEMVIAGLGSGTLGAREELEAVREATRALHERRLAEELHTAANRLRWAGIFLAVPIAIIAIVQASVLFRGGP